MEGAHCPTCVCGRADHHERTRAAMTEYHELCEGCGVVKAKRLLHCERCGLTKLKSENVREYHDQKKERLMQRLKVVMGLVLCLAVLPWSAEAATEMSWARNSETDMLQYRVYACVVKDCVAVKGVTPTAIIPQTAAGVRPKWTLMQNTEGAAVVTAVRAASPT